MVHIERAVARDQSNQSKRQNTKARDLASSHEEGKRPRRDHLALSLASLRLTKDTLGKAILPSTR